MLLALLFVPVLPAKAQADARQHEPMLPNSSLPEAPEPQSAAEPSQRASEQTAQQTPQPVEPPVKIPAAAPCQIRRDGSAILQAAVAGAVSTNPDNPMLSPSLQPSPCPPLSPLIDWYARFLNGPQVKPLTPKEKGWLAVRDLGDPFNFLTIAAISAIAVGSNAHSPYGPGMTGFGRNAGVSFTQDMTAEFFGTFAIPSLVHQDPHYHRMPSATIKRRFVHAIVQVVWTQGDNGKGMVNYGNLVGFGIDGAIANLYVPGQETNVPATVQRYATTLGTAPIDNFIVEFLPSVASRIHTRVVFVQNIINQVARTETATQ